MSGFGLAVLKAEGERVAFDHAHSDPDEPDPLDCQWFERDVPRHLHDQIHAYIDQLIAEHA